MPKAKTTTKKKPAKRKAPAQVTPLQKQDTTTEINLRMDCIKHVYTHGADHTISEAKKIYNFVKGK